MDFISKPIARFWSRCVKGTKHDGLIIGSQFVNQNVFEENTVYEAHVCGFTGDITFKKLGPAAVKVCNGTQLQANIQHHGKVSPYNYCHISQRYEDIVTGRYCFLTESELYDMTYRDMIGDLRLSGNDTSLDLRFIDCAHFIKKD